jgi:hypothetical protein
VKPIWDTLYAANADVVVNGHDHDYERFAPQTPSGAADPTRGIREFVVGTGGAGLREFKTIKPNSEKRNETAHGVLKLTLNSTSYDWEFVPVCPGAVPVLVYHDEVVVECDEGRGEETEAWLEKAKIEGMDVVLNGTDEVDVPVGVEDRIARSWGEGD